MSEDNNKNKDNKRNNDNNNENNEIIQIDDNGYLSFFFLLIKL